jgi:nitrogen regulatory protein PII
MQPSKRIEVIIDSLGLEELVNSLKAQGVSGYTIIRDVSGMGDRGARMGDELTEVFKNIYVIIACPEEKLTGLVEAIRPQLKRFGGVCLVSDAMWIKH